MLALASNLVALLSLTGTLASAAAVNSAPAVSQAPLDTVVFAGGCFWGVQGVFQHVNGVVSATSGYAGGAAPRPSYGLVSTGTTGHAESVRVVFDPSKVTYEQLLTVFFRVAHDPTQLNRQGPDVGSQYRSAIFYTTERQHRGAQAYIAQLEHSGVVRRRIVTQIAPLGPFTVAEAYHQDYATLHPDQPYVKYNDLPKIAQLKQQYPELWTERLAAH